jgi:hypothetical protein
MPLVQTIRRLIAEGHYVVGEHALERLAERGIMEWQAVEGAASGKLIDEQPKAKPNPKVEIEQLLPDGTPFKAIWSYIAENDVAKLVTVHFFDR